MEKNKELTPMMELIEKLESRRESMRILDEDGLLLKNEFIHKSNEINSIQLLISNMLPKEKQVIEDAFDNVVIVPDNWDGETYYNTKYNN